MHAVVQGLGQGVRRYHVALHLGSIVVEFTIEPCTERWDTIYEELRASFPLHIIEKEDFKMVCPRKVGRFVLFSQGPIKHQP